MLTAAAFAFTFSSAARAADEPAPALKWEPSLAEGLKRAKAEKKLVFADFWRDNCVYCVRMEQQTFPDPAVARLLAEQVIVKAKNVDHAAEIERYEVSGYPTLALLDPEGNVVDIQTGFMGELEFGSWLSGGASRYRRMQSLRERIARDPADLAAILALGKLLAGEGKREEARAVLAKIPEADREGKRRETAEALLEIGLIARRSRDYKLATESIGRARELALARLAPTGAARRAGPTVVPASGPSAGPSTAPAPAPEDLELLDRVLYELATALMLAGKRPELVRTLEEYDRSVKTADARRHGWILLQLGQQKLKDGDREAARRAFARCDELYPRSEEARQCRQALAELK